MDQGGTAKRLSSDPGQERALDTTARALSWGLSAAADPLAPAVAVRALEHRFAAGEDPCLRDIRLELMPGELVIMTGPSGSGKTTLLTLIGALRTVQAGSLVCLGRELLGLRASERMHYRREVGFIFQTHNLFHALTASENVQVGLELSKLPRKEKAARTRAILERVGLGHRLHHRPHELSGGQRQRVAVARALVNHPRLILADEPTASLDEASSREVVALLRELADDEGATIIVVTHDPRIINVANRLVSMVDGRIASDCMIGETVKVCEWLSKIPLFKEHPPSSLTEIADRLRVQRYPDGAAVVKQGEEGDSFYLVREGKVDVSVDKDGERQTVAELGPGDFFGEVALLKSAPRNATVTARGYASVYALDAEGFRKALERCGSFRDQVQHALFRRI